MKSIEEWKAEIYARHCVMDDPYRTILEQVIRDGIEAIGDGYHYVVAPLVSDEWLEAKHLPKNYRKLCQSILEDISNLKPTDITRGALA